MAGRSFLDTNIILYADDADAGAKTAKAREILHRTMSDGSAVVSTQVLQEYFVIATRKLKVDAGLAHRKVELLARTEVVIIRPELVLAAIDLHRLHAFSLWDALIVRSASVSGCTTLLSEDMQHGQVIDGVRIHNPFAV